jgi:hypothetical protein
MSSVRSAARGGTFSNRSTDTFATVSGTTRTARLLRPPICCSAVRTAAATVERSAMFGALSAGTTAPGGNGSTARPVTSAGPSSGARRTAAMRVALISTPTVGGGVPKKPVRRFIRRRSPC